MGTKTGTETHSIVDNTPGETGCKHGWGLVQRLDPASAQANLNLMSNILQPPNGSIANISSLIENGEEWCGDRMSGQADML